MDAMSGTVGFTRPSTTPAVFSTLKGTERTPTFEPLSWPIMSATSFMRTGRSQPMSIRSPSTPGASTASAR